MAIVGFPDGTRVRASSISDRCVHDPERTFGLYLDARWEPTWPATVIAWQDFGLPENPELAAQQIAEAFGRAGREGLVEVGCLGGSGRTGTVLACMAILAGVPPARAVAWVRASYRPEAVETADQEAWVQWFAEWVDAHPEATERPRPLTRRERDVLDYLLSVETPGIAELRQQAETARAIPWDCGCASIDLIADREAAPKSSVQARPAVEAASNERNDPERTFDLLLWVEDGWLSGLEIVDYGETHGANSATFLPLDSFAPPRAP